VGKFGIVSTPPFRHKGLKLPFGRTGGALISGGDPNRVVARMWMNTALPNRLHAGAMSE